MYKFVVFSVIALIALEGAIAKPRPKQGAAPAEKSTIDELTAAAQQMAQNVSSVISGSFPDSKQIVDSLTDNSQKLATKLKSLVDDLNQKTQEHKGDAVNALNQIKDNLSATATKLQEAIGPDATAKAKQLKITFDEGVQKAISEAEKLAKTAEPEATKLRTDLTNAAKSLLDHIVEVTKDVKHQLDKSVAQKH